MIEARHNIYDMITCDNDDEGCRIRVGSQKPPQQEEWNDVRASESSNPQE